MNKKVKLDPRQKRFCEEYLQTGNAARSAINAGYSEKNAATCGNRLLQLPAVQQYLQKEQEKMQQKYAVSRERLIYELALIAFSDIGDYYDEHGIVKSLNEINPEQRRALSGLRIRKNVTKTHMTYHVDIKTHDKIYAIIQLGRHLGFFDKEEIPGQYMRRLLFVDSTSDDDPSPRYFTDPKGEPVDQEEIGQRYRAMKEAKKEE